MSLRVMSFLIFALTSTWSIAADDALVADKLSAQQLITYGNWCGADHPQNINEGEAPIDALDEACKVHDFCYTQQGYFDCGCDKALNQQVRSGIANHQFSGETFLYARALSVYFDGSPCKGDHSGKFGPSQAILNAVKKGQDHAIKIKDKVESILDKLPFVGD